MLTREQIEEIQTESREKGVSIKNILKEKDVPESQYFWWRRKYSKPEVQEGFLPVSGSGLPAAMAAHLSGTSQSPRSKSKSGDAVENWMSIELRTVGGTDMRIQGGLTPAMMYTILKSL